MKNPIQSLKMATTLSLATSLLMACGGKFEATSNSSESRPPATSDPLTAQQQRQWESAQQGRRKIKPILETEAERESFLQDLTEQMPTYSADDLAKDAENSVPKKRKRAIGESPGRERKRKNRKKRKTPRPVRNRLKKTRTFLPWTRRQRRELSPSLR